MAKCNELKYNKEHKTTVQKKNSVQSNKEMKNKKIPTTRTNKTQVCAWVLLTVGVCFISITICIAVIQSLEDNIDVATANDQIFRSYSNLVAKNHDDANGKNSKDSRRLNYLDEQTERNFSRCQETLCRITCANVANIYTGLHESIKNSSCRSIDVLLLDRQDFPSGVLKNYWLSSNITFKEVIIRFGKISTIKNNAFNAPLFEHTLVLSLDNMNITTVESGALWGLRRLKYLAVQSRVKNFEPAIVQPVQDTLINLKLNALLRIHGNKNLFSGSYLNKLQYLDLSSNIFNGSLGKNLFESTPNLKYLIIMESNIQHIEKDAFANLVKKILFINLSKNRLTTLTPDVFQPILVGQKVLMINLADNDWNCNCQLSALIELYKTYRLQFMDILYCKAPHELYGVSLDEVELRQENCLLPPIIKPTEEKNVATETEYNNTTISLFTQSQADDNDDINNNEVPATESSNIFKMRCVDNQTSNPEDADKQTRVELKTPVNFIKSNGEYLSLPAPTYEFELELIPESNSVIVSIDNPSDVLVIWFSEKLESSVIKYGDSSLDYECMRYEDSQFIVGPLVDNTTYTFCLLSYSRSDISPFNCLPLYMPPKSSENIWISEDNKRFTIGMLCLIFLTSTIAGAVVAYFGLKTFPNILKCSKHELVAKETEQPSYLATISEIEYQKQSSFKRSKNSLKQDMPTKLRFPDIPPMDTSPIPCCMSVNDLNSLKPPSVCYDNAIATSSFVGAEYETPKVCNNEYMVEHRRSVPITYCMSSTSPPPLPKRNSNISNSSTLSLNRSQ